MDKCLQREKRYNVKMNGKAGESNKTKPGNHALSEAFSFQDLPLSEGFCIPNGIAPGGNGKLSGDCRWGGALDGSEQALDSQRIR